PYKADKQSGETAGFAYNRPQTLHPTKRGCMYSGNLREAKANSASLFPSIFDSANTNASFVPPQNKHARLIHSKFMTGASWPIRYIQDNRRRPFPSLKDFRWQQR